MDTVIKRNEALITRLASVFIILAACCLLISPAQAQPASVHSLTDKSVLIIHSYEANLPFNLLVDRGVSTVLEVGGIPSIKQFFESLDLRRNPGLEHRKILVEQMRSRYGHRSPDMIITMFPDALEFVLEDCRDILPDVPILALAMPAAFDVPQTDRRIITQSTRLDYAGTLEIALKLFPGTERVYLASGADQVDKGLEAQARDVLRQWETPLEIISLSHLAFEDILATLSSAPSGSLVLAMSFTHDATGQNFTAPIVAQRLSQVSKAPIFGIFGHQLGYGIVGGSLMEYERLGNHAGQLVLDILGGIHASKIMPATLDISPVPKFDWLQLRRWNLSEAALPEGSIVINRETTLWDFRHAIFAGLMITLVQAALIIGLLAQRRSKGLAEASLQRKTEELDQFFNISLDLLCVVNAQAYFLRLNPAWEKLLGYNSAELKAVPFFHFVHPDDLARTRDAMAAQATQQDIVHFENRYRCKDNTYRWLEWVSAPAGELIYATARDVTERKRAEIVIRERLRFEQLVSQLSGKLMDAPFDRLDGEIENGLAEIRELFAVDHCALLQASPREGTWIVSHASFREGEQLFIPRFTYPKSLYPWMYTKLTDQFEIVFAANLEDLPPEADVDKSSLIQWGIRSFLNIPILTDDSVVYVIHVNSMERETIWEIEIFPRLRLIGEFFVNSLKRKQAMIDAANFRNELLRLERVSQLGELTSTLAHEISQPLSAIRINARTAQHYLSNPTLNYEEIRQIIDDVLRDACRAGDVIHKVKAQVRKEPPKLGILVLNTVIQEVVGFFRRDTLLKGLTFSLELSTGLMVLADRIQIQQVILNLILNSSSALQNAPLDQRTITIRTTIEANQMVKVSVTDHGVGIDVDNLNRIFEPFYTTKREGLGMGLSISRQIIQSFGGTMEAFNNPEGGATFAFTLPVHQGDGGGQKTEDGG